MTNAAMTVAFAPHRQFQVHGQVTLQVDDQALRLPPWFSSLDDASIAPDVNIQIVERLSVESLRFIEHDRLAICESGLVFCGKHAHAKKILVLMQSHRDVQTLVCEKGASLDAALEAIVHAAALQKGVLPLHAAAFGYGDQTIVASGFPSGGKTSLMLAFAGHGATYISDDWIYVDPQDRVFGIALPVSVRAWQLDQRPDLKALLSPKRRLVHLGMRSLSRLSASVTKIAALRYMGLKAARAFEDRAAVKLSPKRMFGTDTAQQGGSVDHLLLTMTHDRPEIAIETLPFERALPLLLQMQLREWDPLLRLYATYKSVYGDPNNPLLDNLAGRLEAGLRRLLAGRQIRCIYHPSPISLDVLFHAVEPHLSY